MASDILETTAHENIVLSEGVQGPPGPPGPPGSGVGGTVTIRTAAEWTALNPTLVDAEIGYERDTQRLKMGDGVTAWTGLPYVAGGDLTIAQVTGLQSALDGKLASSDASVTNAREWTAATVTQVEAEAGTDTARKAWTVQRVVQAVAAWWAGSAFKTKLDGIEAGAQVNAVTSVAGKTGAVTLAKTDVGLGSVDNTSDLGKPISTATQAALDAKVSATEKGAVNGVTPLDASGKVPATYLPSYVDDVVEASSVAALPATGEAGKIYTALDSGKIYRWSGSAYAEISPSPGSTDAVPEGASNLYFTTARASAAAPVQSVAGKTGAVTLVKTDVGLGNVNNTSDADKPISTATQSALDARVTNPMTTAGDLITGGASGVPQRLAAGTNGHVLKMVSGAPAWAAEGGGASVTTAIPIAVSDESTALTTGTAKVTFRMPFAFTLTGVRASVTTAPTGSVLTVDINEGGTSILSTKLTIDASEKTSTTAATPAVISDTALADDAEITIDIDTVGSTVAGAGLKVYLIGTVV